MEGAAYAVGEGVCGAVGSDDGGFDGDDFGEGWLVVGGVGGLESQDGAAFAEDCGAFVGAAGVPFEPGAGGGVFLDGAAQDGLGAARGEEPAGVVQREQS